MMWFKACPRCLQGDLSLNKDLFSWYLLCLQCGYLVDVDNPGVAGDVVRATRVVTQTVIEKVA